MAVDSHPQPDSDAIDFAQALGVLRRRLPLIVLCMVVVGAAAFAFSKQQSKEYTATSALQFGASNPFAQHVLGLSSSDGSSSQSGQQASNVELVQLGDLAAKTSRQVGVTEAELRENLKVAGAGESNIVSISATAGSPEQAARIANVYARQFVHEQSGGNRRSFGAALALVNKQLNELPKPQRFGPIAVELQNRAQTLKLLDGIHYGNVQIAARARPPTAPSSPDTKMNTVVGVMLGLLIGLGLAFALERLERDRWIRDSEDLESIYRLPLLGAVPENPMLSGRRSGLKQAGSGITELEAFQMIRARLRFFSADGARRIILVAAAEQGDGATTVARGLSEAGVRSGSRVLLLETDLRNPALASLLELDVGLGLAEVLTGHISVNEAIQSVELSFPSSEVPLRRLAVLPGGSMLPANSSELLESHAMQDVLQHLRGIYDLVVIDAPPFTARADAFGLLPKVDGVVAVSRIRHSKRSLAEDLHRTLEISGASQLGVIANGVRAAGARPEKAAEGSPVGRPPASSKSAGDDSPQQRTSIEA